MIPVRIRVWRHERRQRVIDRAWSRYKRRQIERGHSTTFTNGEYNAWKRACGL